MSLIGTYEIRFRAGMTGDMSFRVGLIDKNLTKAAH